MGNLLIPVNCPRCGRPLRFVGAAAVDSPFSQPDIPAVATYFTFECKTHGTFQYGPDTPRL
jgi:hypothetical protein